MSERTDDGWHQLAQEMQAEVSVYFATLQKVAAADTDAATLPLLLLSVGQLSAAGSRLGALVDVVPAERFEPDPGPDADLDRLRVSLRELLGGLDTYCDLEDPVLTGEVTAGSLSDDLVAVAADLHHGQGHYAAGRHTEAMWWWQFSYLSSWGERAASALRVLVSLLAHARLDADEAQVMEAELEALHHAE